MNTLDVYNLLDGKSLCNIFASVIVNKINDSCVDAITEITVVNVRSFFIIKGKIKVKNYLIFIILILI